MSLTLAEFQASQGCIGRLCLKQQNKQKTDPISQPGILTSQHLKQQQQQENLVSGWCRTEAHGWPHPPLGGRGSPGVPGYLLLLPSGVVALTADPALSFRASLPLLHGTFVSIGGKGLTCLESRSR